jgi:hypothetical protein
VGAVRRDEEEGWVERVLEEVRREFSGLPVYVGVEEGYVYVKRTALLEILVNGPPLAAAYSRQRAFQPFLRFLGSCGWLLWVFKFFFGFLSSRRSAWSHALHSFHSALGEVEAPFFGAS